MQSKRMFQVPLIEVSRCKDIRLNQRVPDIRIIDCRERQSGGDCMLLGGSQSRHINLRQIWTDINRIFGCQTEGQVEELVFRQSTLITP